MSGPQRPGYMEEEIHVNGSGVFGALQKFSTSSLWWYAFVKTHWTVHLPLVNSIVWNSDLNWSEFLKSTCDLDLSPWAMWKHISWELPLSFCPHKAGVLSSCLVGWSVYSGKPNALSTLLNHMWLWTLNSRPQFYQMVKVKKRNSIIIWAPDLPLSISISTKFSKHIEYSPSKRCLWLLCQ